MSRIVVHFSCGAASAVVAKLILAEGHDDVQIVNAYIEDEHADNRRFADDCEQWFGHPITVLRDTKYNASPREVWRKHRFMKGPRGAAPCSAHLKAGLLDKFSLPGDVHCLGFTAEEAGRFARSFTKWADVAPRAPLIERGLMKADCLAIVQRAGIELPMMYRLGYHNANCIGCIKGGEGYWNKIRVDFPERFNEIADIQESIGQGANLFRNRKTGVRYSLRELQPDAGRHQDEPEISCGFACEIAEQDLEQEPQMTAETKEAK